VTVLFGNWSVIEKLARDLSIETSFLQLFSWNSWYCADGKEGL